MARLPSNGQERQGPNLALNYCDGMSSSRPSGAVELSSAVADRAAIMPFDKSRTALVRRARTMNRILAATYPDAHTELDFTNPPTPPRTPLRTARS
jgi:hypothetical protein